VSNRVRSLGRVVAALGRLRANRLWGARHARPQRSYFAWTGRHGYGYRSWGRSRCNGCRRKSGRESQWNGRRRRRWIERHGWTGGGGWQRLFDFGDGVVVGTEIKGSTTLYLTPQAGSSPNYSGPAVLLSGFKRADQTTAMELNVVGARAMATGTVVHVAVVVD